MKIKCENCGEEKVVQEKWWKFAGDHNCGHYWIIVWGGYEREGWLIPFPTN